MLDTIQTLKKMDFFNRLSNRFLFDFSIHSEIIHIKNKEALFVIKNDFVRMTVNRQIGERFLELGNDRCLENARCHQRVADLLVRLWERQGGLDRNIQIPLTRKDIAHRVGTKPKTIIRILST